MAAEDVLKQIADLTRRVEALEETVRALMARLESSSDLHVLREVEPVYYVGEERRVRGGVVIPLDVLEEAGMTPQEMLVNLAVYLFDQEVLTLGQAKSLAGMPMGDFMQLLGQRGVNMHYDVEDLEEDIRSLKALGLWKE